MSAVATLKNVQKQPDGGFTAEVVFSSNNARVKVEIQSDRRWVYVSHKYLINYPAWHKAVGEAVERLCQLNQSGAKPCGSRDCWCVK